MLQKAHSSPTQLVDAWVEAFNYALQTDAPALLEKLFMADSHWRNIFGLGWQFRTTSGGQAIAVGVFASVKQCAATNFAIHPSRLAPAQVERAGETVIEAALQFETQAGTGIGLLRLIEDPETDAFRAWSLMTAIDSLSAPEPAATDFAAAKSERAKDFNGPNWLERREFQHQYTDRDPEVLIVGGGHAGICAAVELKEQGVDALVIDRYERVGDNWRNRYRSLSLHNKTPSNHLPYMPFPDNWPDYIPKDKIANWLESYVDVMDLNVWTQSNFVGATRDDTNNHWIAQIVMPDGLTREFKPQHIVMATSVSGTPKMPSINTLESFGGKVIHSSAYRDGEQYQGKPVAVFGTGTSAHDVSQDLHGRGANVIIVQRSPSLVVDLEPSAQLYDGIYYDDGPPLRDRDLLNTSVPLEIIKKSHKLLTAKVREIDAPLLKGLENAGFRLEFGEDDTGWPIKYRQRGGGYYFNVGCSELIVNGEIDVLQFADIERFDSTGLVMTDGSTRELALVVLATGYNTQSHLVAKLFDQETADRVGDVWGFDERTQELRNMWVRTAQPGLWFTGGAFSQCRIYSKYLAMQIKADVTGVYQ